MNCGKRENLHLILINRITSEIKDSEGKDVSMKLKVNGDRAELLKETFWLAWQACGSAFGMDVLQPNSTSRQVQAKY